MRPSKLVERMVLQVRVPTAHQHHAAPPNADVGEPGVRVEKPDGLSRTKNGTPRGAENNLFVESVRKGEKSYPSRNPTVREEHTRNAIQGSV
jgi:hypothetical protein